jgi:hypothetical protein
VVVDNVTSGMVRREVKEFQCRYPDFPLRLFAKRKKSARIEALRQGYGRSRRGEFVVVINASTMLSPPTIKRTVARFSLDDRLQQLLFGDALPAAGTTLEVYAQLLKSSQSSVRKARTLIFRTCPFGADAPLACRVSVLKTHGRLRSDYDSSAGIMQAAKDETAQIRMLLSPFSGGAKWGWVTAAIVFLFAQTYGVYAAASFKSASLLMLAWLGTTVWCVAVTWDGDVKPERLAATCMAPLAYVFIGIHMVAGLVTFLWSLIHSVRLKASKFITEFFTRQTLRHS